MSHIGATWWPDPPYWCDLHGGGMERGEGGDVTDEGRKRWQDEVEQEVTG